MAHKIFFPGLCVTSCLLFLILSLSSFLFLGPCSTPPRELGVTWKPRCNMPVKVANSYACFEGSTKIDQRGEGEQASHQHRAQICRCDCAAKKGAWKLKRNAPDTPSPRTPLPPTALMHSRSGADMGQFCRRPGHSSPLRLRCRNPTRTQLFPRRLLSCDRTRKRSGLVRSLQSRPPRRPRSCPRLLFPGAWANRARQRITARGERSSDGASKEPRSRFRLR